VNTEEPYTTNELLDALATLDLEGVGVGVVHYGERNAQLAETLVDRGAYVEELCVYEWMMPEDIGPLRTLIQEIIDERVDAVVFTSQIQARHLFRVAADLQATDKLAQALNTSTVVASVGPTCTVALRDLGVTPHVEPEHPKSGHLIKALAEYMK
jgi:uroporphyrinogen-III synthase